MPFVQAKCVNCNGELEVDSSKRAAICPYCGTPYVVEDAINHYHNHIEHLHADVVNNYVDESGSEARLKAGETFLAQKHYDSAKDAFTDVINIAPQNYLGWWGKIRAITQEFTLKLERVGQLDELQKLYDSALVVANATQKKEMQAKFDAYYLPLRKKTDEECALLRKKKEQYDAQEKELNAVMERNQPTWKKEARGLPNWVGSILAVVLLVGIVRIFTADASILSAPVILPILIWLGDKIICFAINQGHKNKEKQKMRTRNRVQEKLNQLYREKRVVEDRLQNLTKWY